MVQARVGTHIHERHLPQNILINIVVSTDISKSIKTDKLSDTVDYVSIVDKINALIKTNEYVLIETLADAIATVCLLDPRAKKAWVKIEKPHKLPASESVGVEIEKMA